MAFIRTAKESVECPLWVIRVVFVMSENVRFQGNFGHSGPQLMAARRP